MSMKRIAIERYKDPVGFAGLIEGENDEGRRWVLFLDQDGTPYEFFGDRDSETGAVQGEKVLLHPLARRLFETPEGKAAAGRIDAEVATLQVDWGKEEGDLVTCFPTWEDDQGRIWRGRIYIDAPEEVGPHQALNTMLTQMAKYWSKPIE